jgi:hypothetical protein
MKCRGKSWQWHRVYAAITMHNIRLHNVGCFDVYTRDSSLPANIDHYFLKEMCFAMSMRCRIVSYETVPGHLWTEMQQQPCSKGELGLSHAAKQTKALPGKWFIWMLHLDRPAWCRLARALLMRHLVTAG